MNTERERAAPAGPRDGLSNGGDTNVASESPASPRAAGTGFRSVEASASILNRCVTVCDACWCASCFQGLFYCEDYKRAGSTQKSVRSLLRDNVRESLEHWFRDPNTGRVNMVDADACRAAIAAGHHRTDELITQTTGDSK